MIGAMLAFCAMAIAGRQVSNLHDTFEIMFWRSSLGFVLVLACAIVTGRLSDVRRDRLPSHLIRNIVHFTGQNLWFWALTMIPLAQLFALEFTSPIWVILLSPFLLGEALTRRKTFVAATGFAGILVVAHPDPTNLNFGVLAAAASAVFFATSVILTKALTRGESIMSILFWLTGMQMCFGAVAMFADGAATLPTAETLPWLALIGIAGVVAHWCLTTALSLAPASVVGPIDFLRLPLIAVIGMIFYSEPLEWQIIAGGALILFANVINLHDPLKPEAIKTS